MYRSKKYLKWIRTRHSAAPLSLSGKYNGTGEIVPAHQRLPGSCGTSIKPPDTFALPLWTAEHNLEHQIGHESFWGKIDRAKRCSELVCAYLDEVHNIDGWRLVLDLLTEYMENEKL